MRLYLTAKTSIPDLFIDYIQVKLKSGEEVSLNWDYSDIERTSSGFSARYKGVYFDEAHANGRIDELQDMNKNPSKFGAGIFRVGKLYNYRKNGQSQLRLPIFKIKNTVIM